MAGSLVLVILSALGLRREATATVTQPAKA
jgi:hypothetical protein